MTLREQATPEADLVDAGRHLRALHRLTLSTTQAADVEGVYAEALDMLMGALAADRLAVLVLDPEGVMRFAAHRGLSEGYRAAVEGHSPWSPDERSPESVVIPDVAADASLGPLRATILAEGIGAVGFIPLAFEGRLLGKFMVYFDSPHAFSADELDLARTVAGHIAFVLEKRRLEEELRAGSEELAAILNAVGEAITVQSSDGRLVWANAAAAELLGFDSPSELMASPVYDVTARFDVFDISGAPFPMAELPGRRALAGEEPAEILLRWRVRATGVEHWSLVRSRPVHDDDGRVRLAVSVFRDVTAREQALGALRRSEERFAFLASASRALLSSSLDAEAVAQRITDLAVPVLADWCSAWDVDSRGEPRRHVARVDARYPAGLAAEVTAQLDLLRTHPLWREVVGGGSVVLSDPHDALLSRLPDGDPHHALISSLRARSVLAVPITVRGSVAGVLLMASTVPGRYGNADVSLAEDLGRRAAQALDIARAYEAEQGVRKLAEAATARLALLSEVSRALTTTLQVDELLGRLSRIIVPAFADQCVIDLVESGGGVRRVVVAGGDPPFGGEPGDQASDQSRPAPAVMRALAGETTLISETSGVASAVIVPIWGRQAALGAITFAAVGPDRRLTAEDVGLAEEVGRRAGAAIDNARLFAARSQAVATLSQALLPASLPPIPGVDLAVRYRPAAAGVGGDFYDVVPFGPGRWLLLIGDVCGKGAEAASLTAMARHTVRTLAREHREPTKLLEAANAAMADQLPEGLFCTMAAAVVEPGADGMALTVVVAGHPVPLVMSRSGRVSTVGHGGRLLGPFEDLDLAEDHVVLGPGDALVMVTDGCVGEGMDALDVLGPALVAASGRSAPELAGVVANAAGGVQSDHPDDRAALVVKVEDTQI